MNLNHQSKTVLIFGGTGQQGGAVASVLLSTGWKVRALVRDRQSKKAQQLAASGAEIVEGDLSDSASIRAAMTGVYGVFSIQPSSGQGELYGISDEQEVLYGKTIADIAVELDVQHLVYTSVGAAGKGLTGMGHFDSKTEIEEYLSSLDIRHTIIRPAAFMELLLLPGMGLSQGKYSFFVHPDQSFQIIAVQDIGKIVGHLFEHPQQFAGKTLEIAGDEVTGIDLQKILSQAAGKSIHYQRFTDALLKENTFLGRLSAVIDDGRGAGNADLTALRETFGHLLRFDEWIKGPGKDLLVTALQAKDTHISLR
jgi:uncharacterized protein YbjT (DUF2867 family)